MNVLAIGAHPDDIELYCGGTLARCVQRGRGVSIAVICTGTSARGSMPIEEAVGVRREESIQAARIIGASIHHLGYPDLRIPAGREPCLRLLEVIRRVRPNVILTHAPNDIYPDHRRTNELVETTIHMIQEECGHGETGAPPPFPLVYYMDTVFGRGFHPTDFVNITPVFETKRQMLACHESQIVPWKQDPILDTMEMMEVCARFRGIQANVQYAEAFRIEPMWDRTSHRRLLP